MLFIVYVFESTVCPRRFVHRNSESFVMMHKYFWAHCILYFNENTMFVYILIGLIIYCKMFVYLFLLL